MTFELKYLIKTVVGYLHRVIVKRHYSSRILGSHQICLETSAQIRHRIVGSINSDVNGCIVVLVVDHLEVYQRAVGVDQIKLNLF